MSAKAIHESTGKELLYKHLPADVYSKQPVAVVEEAGGWPNVVAANTWLNTTKLVLKPDQLIKRRGKLGLVLLNKTATESGTWLEKNYGTEIKVGAASGKLSRVLVEPFLPHTEKEEVYVCIWSHRSADTILFHHEGGVDVGDVDEKAVKLDVSVGGKLTASQVKTSLLAKVPAANQDKLANFIVALYGVYQKLYCTYLEINPLVIKDGNIYILDLAMKLDQCAEYLAKADWGDVTFPTPFGRDSRPEEAYIQDLDAKSGASLKLTIINPAGRVWTMVAGGGASVIYADTICALGYSEELANYGEYSGAPSEQQTFDYARTILSLMIKEKHPEGKVLIIGGGIANFTNVAATFKGIVAALKKYQKELIDNSISIYVRRGGPNYQEGLRIMRELGLSLGVAVHVFGPETHMTAICGMALGLTDPTANVATAPAQTANFLLSGGAQPPPAKVARSEGGDATHNGNNGVSGESSTTLFTPNTKTIVWGMQLTAVQGMLDFDFVCRRSEPSVVAMTYPFTGDHKQKFYWGHTEILLPVYKSMADALQKHSSASVLVNFASFRSVYDSTLEALQFPQLTTIAIIAEGVPENLTRLLIKEAETARVSLIGPATVGGIKPGCIKIGNTGGMLDNILSARLHRPGSVAYVSRSGGMSNELNNVISQHTDGLFEGVAIGGDRYPGSTFLDHVLRYEAEPQVGMIVLLGEVGGVEEYRIIDAIKSGQVKKPLVAWCYGTCADMFTSEVQFGHAGSAASAERETARFKNIALAEAGVAVPTSFDELGNKIEEVFLKLVKSGAIIPAPDVTPPTVPMDYNWARELGLIRKPASFMTSICDERGQELLYAGIPITEVIQQDMGIGGVLGLLWFQRQLPPYAHKFLEMCLMVTADHGPAVSGAHNTIVCSRAGKDLVSSLTSGLLTIGDRFGGALDGAARQFSEAFDAGKIPVAFVNDMRKKGDLIMGIGHRVKSLNNPDKRVVILKQYALDNFPSHPLIDYATEVEKITTAKKPNLILNVDGLIGVAMVDLLRNCGCFSRQEADEYIALGCLNAIFVLGRSIGFIGHYLDQRRLRQGLYRHPWDDISYIMPDLAGGSGPS